MTAFCRLIALLVPTAAAVVAQSVPLPGDAPAGAPPATVPVPPALAALRSRCAESIIAADRAVHGQWAATVGTAEKLRAQTGDYEAAEALRQRREEAQARAGSTDGRLSVKLTSRELTNKGSGLTVGENSGTVTLRSAGAFLEWDLSGDYNGWYEVRLTHAVAGGRDYTREITPITGPMPADRRSKKNDGDNSPPRTGGWVSFQNVSNLNRGAIVQRREIVPTGGWNAWRSVSLGRLELNGRLSKFRLTADEAGPDGLMHFKSIELIPSTAPVATDGASRLAKAREAFDKEFRNQILTANTKFMAGLTALETQAARAKDTDAVVRIREEKERLTKNPDKLALGSDESSRHTPPIVLDTGNSFKCQYRGEIRPDSTRTSLTALRPAGAATITWRLAPFNVGSGTYEVTIKGRVPVNGGGTATLAAFGPSSAPAGKVLGFKVKPVVSPEGRNKKPEEGMDPPSAEQRTEEPGSIAIEKGAETLTLTITGLTHSDGWLMDLSKVILTRTGDVKPAKSGP